MNSLLYLELESDILDLLKFKSNYLKYKNRFSFFRRRNNLCRDFWFNDKTKFKSESVTGLILIFTP